jgi:hypothetical protein
MNPQFLFFSKRFFLISQVEFPFVTTKVGNEPKM